MERCTMFMDLKTQYSKDVSSSQIDLINNSFEGTDHLSLKFIWKGTGRKIPITIFKNNEVGGTTLPDVKAS